MYIKVTKYEILEMVKWKIKIGAKNEKVSKEISSELI
jgi:hypothetical protein